MMRRNGKRNLKKYLNARGGWCPCCDMDYDYICEDCGKCRWCCSC